MKVVIDTNVLLKMVSPRSSAYWIRKALENQQLTLCVTTDILEEYEEILTEFYDATAAELFLDALDLLPNVHYLSKSYFFRLIPQDQDDEKFADCAIAISADYLVTNDKHFNVLKKVPFPIVRVVNEKEFHAICQKAGITV
jgi:uncharacterized protein